MSHLNESQLIELVLDGEDAKGQAAKHLATCMDCTHKLANLRDAFTVFSSSAGTMETPSALRANVLHIPHANERFRGFVARVAELFDVSEDEARRVLATIDSANTWEAGPLAGVRLMHLKGGPRVGTADAGLVSFEPGMKFPRHDHHGDEKQIVLQGGFLEDTGREYLAGDTLVRRAGDQHSFVVHKEEPCIIALVLDGGGVIIL
ncbi:MAG: cupin domain-containing protein [Sandaracinaceae bacterium]|nr:cupin domain-containing protein [Sandaracinaceae bacterium]